jgi:hypothetical protein
VHDVDGEARTTTVLADDLLACGVVDAEDLVVDNVAVDPLHIGPRSRSTVLDCSAIFCRSGA